MRKISLMYQLSGGCSFRHKCKECKHCKKVIHNVTINKSFVDYAEYQLCLKHPEQSDWNGNWMACRWFEERGRKKKE